MTEKQFECPMCSAQLLFDPASGKQKCPYCGYVADVSSEPPLNTSGSEESENSDEKDLSEEPLAELDFYEYISKEAETADMEDVLTVQCEACYATTTFDPNVVSEACPFCGTQLVMQSQSKRLIKPKSLMPFKITKNSALEKWQSWISGLWFAPDKFKESVKHAEYLNGVYIPHWTFDAETHTNYKGERGDDYQTKDSNGNKVTKIKWKNVRGQVDLYFDDVLVVASDSVPEKYAKKLQPWGLESLVPYNDSYLSGFKAETYKVDLKEGFKKASEIMADRIYTEVRKDIGGDHQRVTKIHTDYENVTFKHILLPIWIAAYMFDGKIYQFLVNGETGKVTGERPYSWVKIALAVLFAASVIGLFGYLSSR